jgi:hypothetical protein
MREIIASSGHIFLIDDIDFDVVDRHSWNTNIIKNRTYITRSQRIGSSKQIIYLARVIAERMDLPIFGRLVDHTDRNTLNNQRYNLRVATYTQNNYNTGLRSNNRTGYKGVQFDTRTRKFIATIIYERHKTRLGYFDTPEEAALAYNDAAIRLFGEFAYLNQIP